MKFKPNNIMGMIGGVFLGIGVFLGVVAGGTFAVHNSFTKNNPSTNAIIEDIRRDSGGSSSDNDVFVKYEVGEKEYYNELGYYSSTMREGDLVKIYYKSDNPDIIQADTYLGEIITGSMGLLFGAIGLIFLVIFNKQRKRLKNLFENGIRAEALVTGVLLDRTTTVNGRHPFYLTCQITNTVTGVVNTYNSESTFSDLTPYIGQTVTVYTNPSDTKDAYVDIKSLVENELEAREYAKLEYR